MTNRKKRGWLLANILLIAGVSLLPAMADEKALSTDAYRFAHRDCAVDTTRVDLHWLDAAFRIDDGLVGNRHADRNLRRGRSGLEGVKPASDYRAPESFEFKFDFFSTGTGTAAGQTTFRLPHPYGEWTQRLEWTQPFTGQTNGRVDGNGLRLQGSYACAVHAASRGSPTVSRAAAALPSASSAPRPPAAPAAAGPNGRQRGGGGA